VRSFVKVSGVVYSLFGGLQCLGRSRNHCHTNLDLESNWQTPGRDITPMEIKGGTTEDDA